MVRRATILALMLAAVLAVEPLLHNHSLERSNSVSICAICVAGTARLPLATAPLAAPQTVVYTISVIAVQAVSIDVSLLLGSRAPPAV